MSKIWYSGIVVVFLFLVSSGWANASSPTTAETHEFRISSNVKYRCYAGSDAKNATDDRTGEVCDNKTYNSKLVDKVVLIKIVDEPDPESSKNLEGVWSEKTTFKGRKFIIAITLFKTLSPNLYRIRILAKDDEPGSRETVVFAEMKTVQQMNSLSIDHTSMGKKEEISYWTNVQAVVKK